VLFNSFIFLFAFLPITYVVFWSLKSAQGRYVWLAVTGYVFYGFWDYRFCFLMAFTTLVSYSAGRWLLRETRPRWRRVALIVPITCDLLLLGFFKYANFGLNSVEGLARWFGRDVSVPHLNIILPVGISFYTFHTITYIVDSYRGVVRPTKNLFEFAAYVSLFSQLVAGPIVRFRQIEEDLERIGHADRTRWLSRGISIFVFGMVEKVILADALAAVVDPALASYTTLSTAGAWLAILGYTFQLYFDFCGYSDMAVGLGLMFGLRIPWNFNSPYRALNPSDFWQRWHISLSSCLRDYLYIPLGGNRGTEARIARNLMLTMLIGGLWHGASWTFVAWGAYHGAWLVLYRRTSRQWDRIPRVLSQSLTFLGVVIGWVFFRATDFSMVAGLLTRMFIPTHGDTVLFAQFFGIALAFAALWAMAGPNAESIHEGWTWTPARRLVVAAACGAVFAVLAGGKASPFLYFQF
jgi:alginate O-acetyltransferase complex protein AlgI